MAENKESITQVKQTSLSKVITKVFTKTTLSLAMLGIGLFIVIVLSIAQFAFDFEHFNFTKWLSNSMLLTGILMIFMLIGETFKNTIMERPNGRYQVFLKKYRMARENVNNIENYFDDYLIDYREKELEKKKINILINNGIRQAKDLVKLSEDEVRELIKEPKIFNNIKYLRLKEEEALKIIEVLNHTKLGFTNSAYYLNERANFKTTSDQDIPELIYKKKKAYRIGTRFGRIIMGLSFSFLFAALTANEFMNGDDWTAWYNLFSRIFSAISGLSTGYTIAYGINGFEVEELEVKINFLNRYRLDFDNKVYVPKSFEEKFNEQLEQAQKEKEEAVKNVVEPAEIIKPNDPLQLEQQPIINL